MSLPKTWLWVSERECKGDWEWTISVKRALLCLNVNVFIFSAGIVACNWLVIFSVCITLMCTFDPTGRTFVKLKATRRRQRNLTTYTLRYYQALRFYVSLSVSYFVLTQNSTKTQHPGMQSWKYALPFSLRQTQAGGRPGQQLEQETKILHVLHKSPGYTICELQHTLTRFLSVLQVKHKLMKPEICQT